MGINERIRKNITHVLQEITKIYLKRLIIHYINKPRSSVELYLTIP